MCLKIKDRWETLDTGVPPESPLMLLSLWLWSLDSGYSLGGKNFCALHICRGRYLVKQIKIQERSAFIIRGVPNCEFAYLLMCLWNPKSMLGSTCVVLWGRVQKGENLSPNLYVLSWGRTGRGCSLPSWFSFQTVNKYPFCCHGFHICVFFVADFAV